MAYTLQAIIAKEGVLCIDNFDALRVICLNNGFEMIPLGGEARKQLRLDFLPLTDDGASVLPEALTNLCRELSVNGTLAYVEAEFFGGVGAQAHAIFKDGGAGAAPVIGQDAINQALRKIGFAAISGRDEFDCAGLGMHRDIEGWLK